MKPKKQVVAATMKDVALTGKRLNGNRIPCVDESRQSVAGNPQSGGAGGAWKSAILPQSLGRNMKRNESRTILVIVPDICDPFFS